MDRGKLKLLFHTLRHLKFRQIYYRVFYFVRGRVWKRTYSGEIARQIDPLNWQSELDHPVSYLGNSRFLFLNIEHAFEGGIDWDYDRYGKLWTYNLNYFDFLQQPGLTREEGLSLINDYVGKSDLNQTAKEPYPISLRGINWIKFLSVHDISETRINNQLYADYRNLADNLEYHLLGNHLLENGFSLVWGGNYFKDSKLSHKGMEILRSELEEQILGDGAHFELSPMYHQILLYRLLDCIRMLSLNSSESRNNLTYLKKKAGEMLAWLTAITFRNGQIPMVNDSTFGIAPGTNQLKIYADLVGVSGENKKLKESQYRMVKTENYELFMDIGGISPDYQPGHAHADTFNFLLNYKCSPIIVDPGISTYEANNIRLRERSTFYHNTVVYKGQNQSEIWAAFRVARRAKVIKLEEYSGVIEATHNGYRSHGARVKRKFIYSNTNIKVVDTVTAKKNTDAVAHFHFHPSIKNIMLVQNEIKFENSNLAIRFNKGVIKIKQSEYEFSQGYNKTIKALKVEVEFREQLKTEIVL